MNTRSSVVAAALLTAAAVPASGQTAGPAGGPANGGAQGAASIPDFSGIWSHPYIYPGFEPPASGPGPVVNKSRARQVFGDDGRPLPATSNVLVSNPRQLVGDYTNPILKPEAAEVVKQHGEISLTGVAYPTPTNQCWP